MIGKRDKFWGGFEKQSALKLRWRRAADCSRGGIWQPEAHDRHQWTAVCLGSLAARMTTTGDGRGWNRRRFGCNRKDTLAPDRTGIGKWAQLNLKSMHACDSFVDWQPMNSLWSNGLTSSLQTRPAALFWICCKRRRTITLYFSRIVHCSSLIVKCAETSWICRRTLYGDRYKNKAHAGKSKIQWLIFRTLRKKDFLPPSTRPKTMANSCVYT